MKHKISISIPSQVLNAIDTMKGSDNISKYISQVLKDWVELNRPELLKGGDN